MAPDESRAYGEAVRALAMAIFRLQDGEEATFYVNGEPVQVHPPYFYHCSMSLFEHASTILWKLGILRPLNEHNNWATVFKFACDISDVRRIAIEKAKNGPTLNSVLDNFIDLRSEYSHLHSDQKMTFQAGGRVLFAIGAEEVPLFEALTELDYVKRVGDGYVASGMKVDLPDVRPSRLKIL
jgi:hypothetical protein